MGMTLSLSFVLLVKETRNWTNLSLKKKSALFGSFFLVEKRECLESKRPLLAQVARERIEIKPGNLGTGKIASDAFFILHWCISGFI